MRVRELESNANPEQFNETLQNAIKEIEKETMKSLDTLRSILPEGAILATFQQPTNLPDGWVICGSLGTPNLNGQFLVGTSSVDELADRLGQSTHTHSLHVESTGETNGRFVPEPTGSDTDYADNIPNDRGVHGQRNWWHQHRIVGNSETSSNLPPSTKVMFVCRTED